MHADLPAELADLVPTGYSIDSRSISPGNLFFAIRGRYFDGHQFVADALERGAVAAVVSKEQSLNVDNQRLITVKDTLEGLQSLAAGLLEGWGRPVIAITGSAGKTTTKELTALVLEGCGRVWKSTGNLNNAYGLPLSVLMMESEGRSCFDYDFAVLEMGMSSYGEIRKLCELAPPQVAGVLNVGTAHIEFFGSQDAIAKAKAEIVEGVRPGGVVLLNGDDPRVRAMASLHSGEVVLFGIESEDAQVRALRVESNGVFGSTFLLRTPFGEAEANLPLAGRHLIYNALFAASVGHVFGMAPMQITAKLATAEPVSRRGELLKMKMGAVLVDDSYNSSPGALEQAVATMSKTRGFDRKIVVAGEMLELGEASAQLHYQCGRMIGESGIDVLIGVRGHAQELVEGARKHGTKQLHFCNSSEEAGALLVEMLKPSDLILVKGSRGVKTEIVVEAVRRRFELE